MPRGGKKSGAGRKPRSEDYEYEIFNEFSALRRQENERHAEHSLKQYWFRFRTPEILDLSDLVRETEEQQKTLSPKERKKFFRTELGKDHKDRLRAKSGPNGRRLIGAHHIVLKRPHGVRKQLLQQTADNLNIRNSWSLSSRTVERVVKAWEAIAKRLNSLN